VPRLIFVLNDGSEVETSFEPPYTVREQVRFEEHHKLSFLAIYNSLEAMAEAEGDETALDDARSFKVGWILWFGWMRARPKVAARFETFLDTLADWRVEAEESDLVALEATAGAKPAGPVVDPTQASPTSTPLRSVGAG